MKCVLGCAVLLAVLFPAAAHADTADDQFLAAVHARGITGDPVALIGFAHTMCDVAGTPGAIGPMTGLSMSQRLSMQQVFAVATDGLRVYCPQRSGALPPLA